ncbi:MAG: GAF domain-containing protein, partial [Syntrophales bacterium]|nr:GAF domain-containing protein [Syntrophales bacterium]
MDKLIHILHLEDDEADAELIQGKLEAAGIVCQINCVQTRDEFDESLRRGGYDVILADYGLPMYDGMSALRLVKELQLDVPFIFVSGTMGEDAAIQGLTEGATDYVLKQKLSRLATAVKRALKEAENQRERKRAEEDLSRVNRALRMLSVTNQALVHITDEATLLNEACRISVEVGGYRMAWVGFAERDEAKTVRPVAHAGFESGYIESVNVTWADNERGRGPGGTAIRTGQPCITRNIPLDPAFTPWRQAAIRRGYKSNTALPLISEGQALGELAIYSVETDAFDTKEVEILKEMADDLAFGITALRTRAKRDLAEEVLRHSEKEKTILNEIANIFLTIPDEATYGEVLAVVLRVMKSGYGILGYIGENGDLVIPSLTREVWRECQVPGKSIVFPSDSWGESLWGRAIREKRAFYSGGSFHTPEGHIHIDHFLAVPVVFGQETIGLISVANKEGGYVEDDKDMLERIASYVSPILSARLQRDVLERKRGLAVEALANSKGRLHTLVQTIPDLIWLKDRDGIYLSCNIMFERFFGAREADIVGKTDYDFVDRELADFFREHDRKAMAAGKPTSNEEWITFADDGHCALLDTIKTPMYDAQGILIGVLGIGRDITNRKRMEEELQRTLENLRKAVGTTIQVMVSAVETRDPYTAGHQIRSSNLALAIATEMGLAQEAIDGIRMAGSIHDIGKLSIPAEILSKPKKLTKVEFHL